MRRRRLGNEGEYHITFLSFSPLCSSLFQITGNSSEWHPDAFIRLYLRDLDTILSFMIGGTS